jgi:hypothetical protein
MYHRLGGIMNMKELIVMIQKMVMLMISAIKFKSRLLLIVCLFACFVGCETYNHKIKVTRPDGHEQIISITSLHQKPLVYPNSSGNLRVTGSGYVAPIGWNIDIIMEAEKE